MSGVGGQMNIAAGPSEFAKVGELNPAETSDGDVVAAARPSAEAPASPAASGAPAPQKSAYRAPAELPTQQGPKGLRFDFNHGCRVALPQSTHPWRVRLRDLDTGNILFETVIPAGRISSAKRYYVRIG